MVQINADIDKAIESLKVNKYSKYEVAKLQLKQNALQIVNEAIASRKGL